MQRTDGLNIPPDHEFDSSAFLASVSEGAVSSNYRKNQIVFAQGDLCDGIFFIHAGKIKISVLSNGGKEAVLGILTAGHFLGEGCLSGQTSRIATARAVENCAITVIKKDAMLKGMQDDPAFAEFFMTYLLSRNNRIEGDLIDQLFNSSEKRLARLLLLLANFGSEEHRDRVAVKISQETLAEMIGTTRSRVSFFMNKFRKLGFISYNGEIHVHQSLLSAVMHDQPGSQETPRRSAKQ